jgi:hypothetical protein
MNKEIVVLMLALLLSIIVGVYVYKKEFAPKPKIKPIIKYYHINF